MSRANSSWALSALHMTMITAVSFAGTNAKAHDMLENQNITELPPVLVVGKKELPPQNTLAGPPLKMIQGELAETATLLTALPNIQLAQAGAFSSLPSIRGLQDDQLKIQINGMQLISSCSNHMNPPLSYIDPNQVGFIKVYRGVSPVSVAGDNIGGTIIVEPLPPKFALTKKIEEHASIGGFYYTNGDQLGAHLNTSLATEHFFLRYQGAGSEGHNYKAAHEFKRANIISKENPQAIYSDVVDSTRFKGQNHALKAAWQNNGHIFEVDAGLQHIPYQDYPNQRMDMTGNNSHHYNLHYTGQYGWGILDGRFYQEKTRHSMNFGSDKVFYYPGDAQGMPMETEGKTTGADVKGQIKLAADSILNTGVGYHFYRLNDWWPPTGTGGMAPNNYENINNGTRAQTSVYAEWDRKWSPKWTSLIGARGDRITTNAQNVQGYNNTYNAEAAAFNAQNKNVTNNLFDASAIIKFTPSLFQSYELGLAHKNRVPNLYERYTWSTGGMVMRMINFAGDGNGYVGDISLKPEVANTISLTANFHDPLHSWHVGITPYYSKVNNFIDALRCGSGKGPMPGCTKANLTAEDQFVYLRYANQDARIYGVDVDGFMPLGRWDSFGNIDLKGSLGYTHGTNTETGSSLYHIMPLNAAISIEHHKGKWHNTLATQMVDKKDRINAERNEMPTPGYALLHFKTGYQWKNIDVQAGVNNLLNQMYYSPLAGAYVGQGRTMAGNPSMMAPDAPDWRNSRLPGMGRSFFIAFNYEF